jgi:hypothetical protein
MNYETHTVSLWIDNDQSLYYDIRDHARHARNIKELSNWLKEFFTEHMPDHSGTLWGDLLTASMSKVNWDEVAENEYNEYHSADDDDE